MNKKKREEYFKKVYQNIDQFGFHVTYVMESIGFTPFGYSTGLFKNFKIPELFISGLPNGLTNTLICNYADKFKFNEIPIDEKVYDLIDRFPIYFIEIPNEALEDYTLSSFKYYEDRKFKYLQLIFPDLNGHFPNDQGYDYDQKILGKII
jgi:hypothetical protein